MGDGALYLVLGAVGLFLLSRRRPPPAPGVQVQAASANATGAVTAIGAAAQAGAVAVDAVGRLFAAPAPVSASGVNYTPPRQPPAVDSSLNGLGDYYGGEQYVPQGGADTLAVVDYNATVGTLDFA